MEPVRSSRPVRARRARDLFHVEQRVGDTGWHLPDVPVPLRPLHFGVSAFLRFRVCPRALVPCGHALGWASSYTAFSRGVVE